MFAELVPPFIAFISGASPLDQLRAYNVSAIPYGAAIAVRDDTNPIVWTMVWLPESAEPQNEAQGCIRPNSVVTDAAPGRWKATSKTVVLS